MSVPTGLNSALAGVNKGLQDMQKYASEIASPAMLQGENQPSLTESLIELKASEIQVKASLQAVKVFDEVLGTLLDIKA